MSEESSWAKFSGAVRLGDIPACRPEADLGVKILTGTFANSAAAVGLTPNSLALSA